MRPQQEHEHGHEQAQGSAHEQGAGGHPLESQSHEVDEAPEEATEEHRRSTGEAHEPYGGTGGTDPDETWESVTDG